MRSRHDLNAIPHRFAAQGHQLYTWYKCAGGHVYAINNCGEPQEKGKCFCGGEIGGMKHTLSKGNQRLETYKFSEKVGYCFGWQVLNWILSLKCMLIAENSIFIA